MATIHSFHSRLQTLRIESKKTQAEIAKALNITPQAFSYYINGREPSYEILISIADFFDVSLDYLLGRTTYRNCEEAAALEKTEDDTPRTTEYGISLFRAYNDYCHAVRQVSETRIFDFSGGKYDELLTLTEFPFRLSSQIIRMFHEIVERMDESPYYEKDREDALAEIVLTLNNSKAALEAIQLLKSLTDSIIERG